MIGLDAQSEAPQKLEQALNIADDADLYDFVHTLIDSGEKAAKSFKKAAQRNEDFFHGEQFGKNASDSRAPVVDDRTNPVGSPWSTILPSTYQNHVRNLVNTWKARQLRESPDVKIWPTVPDPVAVQAAETANRLIDFAHQQNRLDRADDDVMRLGGLHGTAGYKICYHPDEDKVKWEKLTIFDFFIDPKANSFDDAQWVIFRNHIDKYDARQMLLDAGIDDEPPVSNESINDNAEQEGVLLFEIWHKPTSASGRLPGGLFCWSIGHNVFSYDYERRAYVVGGAPFPYHLFNLEDQGDPNARRREAKLPLVYFKADERRGSPYGDTPVSDVIPEQQQINEVEASLTKLRRLTADATLVVDSESTAQQWTARHKMVVAPNGLQGVGWVAPPQINSLLFGDREYHFKRMYDIMGLNEQLVGVENIKSGTPAQAIAYLSELDGMKHEGTLKSFQEMKISGWTLYLQLVQYYYVTPKLMRVTNEAGEMNIQEFRGADLEGITVIAEPNAGRDRFHAMKASQAMQDAQAGLISPQAAVEQRSTGADTTVLEHITRRVIAAQAPAVLQGAQPQPDPSIDPTIAQDEIQRTIEVLAAAGAPQVKLFPLLQWKASYAPQPQLPPPGPPPGQPGQPRALGMQPAAPGPQAPPPQLQMPGG